MAAVDLYGNDASTIRNAYKSSLRRDASDDEVTGWLSGSYGGGGVNDWVNQIAGSHEAQQYRAPAAPAPSTPPVVGQPTPTTSGTLPAPAPQQTGGMDPGFSQSLMDAYQRYLGRGASQDELTNWYSGQYGYGSGNDGLGAMREGIRTSGEALARNNGTAPQNAYQDTHYWQTQGVQDTDIFDTTTGQLRPGWERTAQGYSRTGGGTGGTTNVPGPQNGDFQTWFMGLTGGRAPSPQSLRDMEPILQQYGIRLGPPNARGWSDGIILPNGQFVDVITAATETGGTGWSWQIGGGQGGGNVSGGVGQGVQLPGSQYSDPHTKLLEELMLARIGSLQQGDDPGYQQLMGYLQQRFNDLQGPGRTGAENEVIRTQALDPIENDRQAARKRVTERMAAAGHTMESGVMQMALMEVDKAFDGMRASTQNVMATDELQRREGRYQQAEGIAGSLYDIPQRRNREAIGYGGALADLGPQRLQMAMQAASGGGSPYSMFNSLMQMAQMNQDSALLNQQNSSQLWGGLGQLSYYLMNAGR